jgi:hypothetical protein
MSVVSFGVQRDVAISSLDCGKCVARFSQVLEISFVEASTKSSRRLWAGGGGYWTLLSQY